MTHSAVLVRTQFGINTDTGNSCVFFIFSLSKLLRTELLNILLTDNIDIALLVDRNASGIIEHPYVHAGAAPFR